MMRRGFATAFRTFRNPQSQSASRPITQAVLPPICIITSRSFARDTRRLKRNASGDEVKQWLQENFKFDTQSLWNRSVDQLLSYDKEDFQKEFGGLNGADLYNALSRIRRQDGYAEESLPFLTNFERELLSDPFFDFPLVQNLFGRPRTMGLLGTGGSSAQSQSAQKREPRGASTNESESGASAGAVAGSQGGVSGGGKQAQGGAGDASSAPSPMDIQQQWVNSLFEAPELNVESTDNEYKVSMEIPGWNKDELKVNLSQDSSGRRVLSISGVKKDEQKDSKGKVRSSQLSTFSRSLTLPRNAMVDKISAKAENGVLKVTIPRVKQQKEEQGQTVSVQ